MSKKKRKNKRKRASTRLEVTLEATRQTRKQEEEKPLGVLDVRPDLRKTALLTAVCLGLLLLLFLTQSRWSARFF